MKTSLRAVVCLVALAVLSLVLPSSAGTKVWNAATNDWFGDGNWTPGGAPGAADDVVITNAGARVLLTNSAAITSLTISNATLVCADWLTSISASNDVIVRNGGTITLPAVFTNNAMSNRVWIVCNNLTVDAGGVINVTALGYDGGHDNVGDVSGDGSGPGAALAPPDVAEASGAGYGGAGGSSGQGTPGSPYGSAYAPLAPGSGGASAFYSGGGLGYGWRGGPGGGAVFVQAAGTVVVNGSMLANGGAAPVGLRGGGGSGGAIYLYCRSFLAGPAAALQANGGNGSAVYDGGGGGGRIAVWRSYAGQATTLSVAPGWGASPGAGTALWGFLPEPALALTNGLGTASHVATLQLADTVATAVLTLCDASESTNAMVWSVSGTNDWLSLSSAGGVLPTGSVTTLIISNNSTALGEGTYQAALTLTASNATMQGGVAPVARTINVQMEVVPSLPPVLTSITSSSPDGTYTNGDTVNVTVNFSEAVTLDGGTLDVTLDTGRTISIGAFASASSASGSYVVSNGDYTMDLDATAVALSGGAVLTNAAETSAFVALPATTIAAGSAIVISPLIPVLSGPTPTSQDPIPVTVTFPREVIGMAPGDFVLTGGTLQSMSGSGSNYVLNVTPSGPGIVSVALPANKVIDAHNAANLAAATLNCQFAYALTVTIFPPGAGDVAGINLWFNYVVTNTPVPSSGYHFLQWTGSGVPIGHSTDSPLVLTMDRARTLQAIFVTNGPAVTRTWVCSGDWLNPTNWSPAGLPDRQDTVVLGTGTVQVNEPINIAALTVSNATMTVSNWNSALNVGALSVQTGGVITCGGPFSSGPSNRVWIVCDTLMIDAGGAIDASAKGWAGLLMQPGTGPGAGRATGLRRPAAGMGAQAEVATPPGAAPTTSRTRRFSTVARVAPRLYMGRLLAGMAVVSCSSRRAGW